MALNVSMCHVVCSYIRLLFHSSDHHMRECSGVTCDHRYVIYLNVETFSACVFSA